MLNLKKLLLSVLAIFLLATCQSSEVKDGGQDFAAMRPQVRSMDELTVVFSQHEVELDFRKSYFASEAQIFTGVYEGLFSYHPLSLEPVPAVAQRWELSQDKNNGLLQFAPAPVTGTATL